LLSVPRALQLPSQCALGGDCLVLSLSMTAPFAMTALPHDEERAILFGGLLVGPAIDHEPGDSAQQGGAEPGDGLHAGETEHSVAAPLIVDVDQLKAELRRVQAEVQKLQQENKTVKRENQVLKRNLSCVFRTATEELTRVRGQLVEAQKTVRDDSRAESSSRRPEKRRR
jgi:TolA-binding protein